jgi:hypothetical protein
MQIKLVEILTGNVVKPAHIQGNRFWLQEEMEKPGKPREEAPGKLFGVRRSGTAACAQWTGDYAVLHLGREDVAKEKRAVIGKLESELLAMRCELYKLYEPPEKYEIMMRLTATRRVTVEASTLGAAKEMADAAAEVSYEDHTEEDWTVEEVQVEEVRQRSL